MNKPAIDVILANKRHKNFKETTRVSENVVQQRLSSHRSVSILFSHSKLEAIELSKPRCKMSVSYSYGCRECNQNPRVIISPNSVFQEGIVYFKSNCTFSQQYLSCGRAPQALELLGDEKYCYIHLTAINTTLYIDIEYEFIGEVMFNPLVLSEAESFGSLVASVTSNPNFMDGVFKSFMFTSSLLLVVTTTIRVIGKLAILKFSANVANENGE